ncbi:hypothetical protein ColTof4_03601 [Colletotrichum tofieldiae]|nr:hypothetical protein ColTof3_12976 [Colletotrichum tofieldiae]GKT71178.1 hypothetical protein ColTof4_03601 [Colletotrichum tofieldiae]GKT93911.1 hypothetical protein Ct61P_11761 [Colletotrichum tofieldiae]
MRITTAGVVATLACAAGTSHAEKRELPDTEEFKISNYYSGLSDDGDLAIRFILTADSGIDLLCAGFQVKLYQNDDNPGGIYACNGPIAPGDHRYSFRVVDRETVKIWHYSGTSAIYGEARVQTLCMNNVCLGYPFTWPDVYTHITATKIR